MSCCGWRTPPELRYVPPAVICALIAWLYGSFVYFAQPLLLAAGTHVAALGAFHAMTALLCVSLARCLRSRESFVARGKAPVPVVQKDEAPAVESKMNGDVRYCRKCRAVKPDRAHHCSTCRRCVLKMDHHCVYINKCIGFYNYKYFLLFLGWSAVTCLYESGLLFRFLLADSLDHSARLYIHGKLRFRSPSLQVVLVFFFSFCLGAALLCFYAMHLFFTARNYSTLEFYEKRREPEYVNFFDLGVVRNFQEVFGTFQEFPYWALPVQSPSTLRSRGRRFPVNSKYAKDD